MTRKPSGRPAVFLDRDGTLMEDVGYCADPRDVRLLPGVAEALRRLERAGFVKVVITNQSGIATGRLMEDDFRRVQAELVRQLTERGAHLDGIYHCPHAAEDQCLCRKPGTELHQRAIRALGIDPGESWCIGDRPADVDAARALGARGGVLVLTGEGASHAAELGARGVPVEPDLEAAVERILRSSQQNSSPVPDGHQGPGEIVMERRTSVLIVDDHTMVAHALRSTLEEWYRVAGVVHTVDAVTPAIIRTGAEVVVLDISFPEGSSLLSLADLVACHPGVRFVMLTAHADPILLDAALDAGAVGFVLKSSAPTELRVAIEEAIAGRTYVTPLLRMSGTDEPMAADAATDGTESPALSLRQRRIMELLRDGRMYKQIAEELDISVKTVEYHLNAIRGRLGLAKVSQIVEWAREHLPADQS